MANETPTRTTWRPGQSGNPNGRPIETEERKAQRQSLKEYAREAIANMTPEEKDEFMSKIPPLDIWKMSEGNPETKQELSGPGGKDLFVGLSDEDKQKIDVLLANQK